MIVEFHCHTSYSKDSLTRPRDLVVACRRRGIDRVVVTDHNTIRGGLEAHALDPQRVIVGEEIMTSRGEILAAFVQQEVPAHLSPAETIIRLREQGAYISVSHPFDTIRKGGWQEADLLKILPDVDAVEVFNSRCMLEGFNLKAGEFAQKHGVPGTVGSDAHTIWELGRAVMRLEPFEGPDEFRSQMRTATLQLKRSPWWVHFFTRYASFRRSLKS